MQNIEILVIGGGIAGVSAALAAAASGARVTLIRPGPGATALCSGGWADAPPPQFRSILADSGLELVDCDDALPHPSGRLISCACAGASHARASIADDTVVAGIAGLPGFRPVALAALWGSSRPPVNVLLDATPPGGWSPASLATSIEEAPDRFAAQLRSALAGAGAARVIVPAVLGRTRAVHREVSSAAGFEVVEALGGTPSLPGWRLDLALLRALASANVSVVAGRVTSRTIRDSRVHDVTVGTTVLQARAFVLATGKYIAGGIEADDQFIESALGCDVDIYRFGRSFDDPAESISLTDPVRTEAQPMLGAGVHVDVRARPASPAGDVRLTNVFVAGSVRAGIETAALGLGAAAHEGWNAGVRATSEGG